MAKTNARLDHRKYLRAALWRTLLFPILILIFFTFASAWYSSKVHESLRDEISASTKVPESKKAEEIAFFDKLDLEQVAFHPTPREMRLSEGFGEDGIVGTFECLWLGFVFSVILVVVLAIAMLSLMSLNLDARKSVGDLVRSYRWGWRIVMTTSLIKLVLLIPLMTYGAFEFSVLLANQYFPKLLFFIVIGGIVALWASIKVLLKKVPMEFVEPLSRELTAEQAPEMWEAIRQAADTVQATAPDRVIVGMQLNFFVTELAVKTDTVRVTGRTLFLSYPLIKQLSRSEVLAIIGHELGHFKGNDTRMTREFYPLRHKVNETLMSLSRVGLVGWPSTGLLMFFNYSFETAIQQLSRKREFLADQVGAASTSADTLARALVKFSVLVEVFQRMLKDRSAGSEQIPMAIRWHSFIGEKILPTDPFWTQLAEKEVPHPLDSHPPLLDRLQALGGQVQVADAREISLQDTETAYDAWFANHGDLFSDLSQKVDKAMGELQARGQLEGADYQTPEGKELLEQHFPDLSWGRKRGGLIMGIIVFGAIGLICLIAAVFAPGFLTKMGIVAVAVLFGGLTWHVWSSRHDKFILTADGVTNPRWKRTLHFSEVQNIVLTQRSSVIQVGFRLKEKQKSFAKWSITSTVLVVVLPISTNWNEKPVVIAQTIYRYYAGSR